MAAGDFRWNARNFEHATRHGVTIPEIERIVHFPNHGYPRHVGNEKLLVVGRGRGDRVIEVIYLLDPDRTFYVIHAMPLTTRRRRS